MMSNLQLYFSHFFAWLKKEQTWPHFGQYLLVWGQDSTEINIIKQNQCMKIHKIILTIVTSKKS